MHRGDGLFSAAKGIGRSLLRSICSYQIQEVRGRVIWDQDPVPSSRANENAVECVIVEPGSSLDRFASEFSLPFRDSFQSLRKRLDQGSVVILARRPVEGGIRREIVGYSIMECGGFSAAGIKGRISPDILFVHYTEVTPKYRGQRIAEIISRARNAYCRSHGIKKSCTAHNPSNFSSERAFRKFGSRVLCYAVRVSLFRGLVVWHTPWKKIEKAIAGLDEEPVRGSGFEVGQQVEVEAEVQQR
jgi:GNAT superfamily N-acetyltransferase